MEETKMNNITFNKSINTYFTNEIYKCSENNDNEKMSRILNLAKNREKSNFNRFVFPEIILPALTCLLVLFFMFFPVQTHLDKEINNYLTVENRNNMREAIIASLRLLK